MRKLTILLLITSGLMLSQVPFSYFAYSSEFTPTTERDFLLSSTPYVDFNNNLTVAFSTYLCEDNDPSFDYANAVAVDSEGYIYVTGYTYSDEFPTVNAFQEEYGGNYDAFVCKLTPNGTQRVYSTYIGGSGANEGNDIAVDSDGNCYITGYTGIGTFPVKNALDTSNNGDGDAFVLKLNSTGNGIVFSTRFGGGGKDTGNSIAIDDQNNVYITGYTHGGLPIVNAYQPSLVGDSDVFVAKINATGTGLVYSTYLGGLGDEYSYDVGESIAVDAEYNTYICGRTSNVDFPLMNANDTTYAGTSEAFVTKINATGNGLIYSTYLGGDNGDSAKCIAVDDSSNCYVGGRTRSPYTFPILNAFDSSMGDAVENGFLTKFSQDGLSLEFSTFVGCDHELTNNGEVADIALDDEGDIYITGYSGWLGFPLRHPFQDTVYPSIPVETFIMKINKTDYDYIYSSYLGGEDVDRGRGIAVGPTEEVLLCGYAESKDFPVRYPLHDSNPPTSGYDDGAFLTKVIWDDKAPILNQPNDVEVSETDQEYSIQWSISESNLENYTISLDGEVIIVQTKLMPLTSIEYSPISLSVGIHTVVLNVRDLSGHISLDAVEITVHSSMSSTSTTTSVSHSTTGSITTTSSTGVTFTSGSSTSESTSTPTTSIEPPVVPDIVIISVLGGVGLAIVSLIYWKMRK
ncbi:MAG: SBBP repeat-containing protein [Candidatus Thorarchaeota archaeon]